jgi:hypothetical protein
MYGILIQIAMLPHKTDLVVRCYLIIITDFYPKKKQFNSNKKDFSVDRKNMDESISAYSSSFI